MDDLKLYSGSQLDIDTLIQTVYTVTDDMDMRLGIDKCSVLVMRRDKESECEGLTTKNGEVKGEIDDDG